MNQAAKRVRTAILVMALALTGAVPTASAGSPSWGPARHELPAPATPRSSSPRSASGATSGVDSDGDGIADGSDACPTGETGWTSNPTTDRDEDGCRDAGEDTDDDNDGKADGSDSCPAGDLAWTSNGTSDIDGDGCRDAGEDVDDDNDTFADGVDNCPLISNPDQTDTDHDGIGPARFSKSCGRFTAAEKLRVLRSGPLH